jgi:nucleotide-binding universal stress UspA family protein
MLSLKKILVPVDFSDTSMQALDYALDLANKVAATISVVHVYQIPLYSFPDGMLVAPAELAADLSARAQRNLDAAVAGRQGRGVELSGTLVNGVPWEEICAFAKSEGADLIVMGTHARRGVPRALLGSVAENVIRSSSIPVLALHGLREAA